MKHIFDWRFLVALIGLILVGSVCLSTVTQAEDNAAKGDRIDVLISNQAREDERAAKQRDQLIRGQQDLQRKYDELAEANQQMADLLAARGIPLPSSVTRIERSSSSDNDDDDGGDDGDTIIVRPPTSNPTPRPPPDDDDDNGDTIPDVDDLTDMTDDIVDDLLNSVPEQ